MIELKEIAPVGKFFKTHALKGELNAVFDIDADLIDADIPLIVDVDGIFVPFFIDGIRPKGQFASLIKLEGVDSEEDAKPFVNKTIYLLKKDLPEEENTGEGGYADDFVGYLVIDTELGMLGKIHAVDLSTCNALFIVKGPDESDIYIPISEEFIVSIAPDSHEIVMNLPEGLIDLNTKKLKT